MLFHGTVGGITGTIKGGQIKNCINDCDITNTIGESKGGLAGVIENTTISDCINNADIYGESPIGGIVGYSTATSTKSIVSNCKNTSKIEANGKKEFSWPDATAEYGLAGGIIGRTSNTQVENCSNSAQILGTNGAGVFIGGIIGAAENNSSIQLCKNTGEVSYQLVTGTGTNGSGLGGVVGFLLNSTVEQSFNKALVSSKYVNGNVGGDFSGGVVGIGYNASIKNAFNTGAVIGRNFVAGIAACLSNNDYVYNCYNASTEITGTNFVGKYIGAAGDDSDDTLTGNNHFWVAISGLSSVPMAEGICTWGTVQEFSTQADMKSDTLLNLLNTDVGSGLWTRDSSGTINDGYPYLINNVP